MRAAELAQAEPTGRPRRRKRLRGSGRLLSGPLAVPNFRLLCIGQLTSTAGDFCYAVALPWLVLSARGGPVLLGTVLACYGVPRTVLIPAGGVLTDRLSPRTVMVAADTVRCVLVAVLTVLAAKGLDTLAVLGPVAALIGAGEGVFLPASMAIMPSLLTPDALQSGNGLSGALMQIGSFAGPVLGGVLVAAGGSAAAFAVDAATFAISAATLAAIRLNRPSVTAAAGTGSAGTAAEGTAAEGTASAGEVEPDSQPRAAADEAPTSAWRLLRRTRGLQVMLFVSVLANFVISGAFEVALPALAHARFGAAGYGALIACFGVGTLAGTLAAAKAGGLRNPARAAGLAFLLGAVAVTVVPFAGGLPGAAAANLAFGATAGFGNIILVTLLQRWAPPQLLGRVMSLVMLASLGAFPAAVALSGVVVRAIGPSPFFPAAGAVFAGVLLLALTQRAFRQFGADAGVASWAAAGQEGGPAAGQAA